MRPAHFARMAYVSALVCWWCAGARGDSLKITSEPQGATVELNGVKSGTTPFEKDFPGGYFRRTKTAFGQRLEHPMTARISLAGYATKEIALTEGPMEWIDLHGRHHGQYWVFKSPEFHAELDAVGTTFTGTVTSVAEGSGTASGVALSMEEIVKRAKPAVVYLKSLERAGTGFLVTETGLIATNAHLARGDSSFLAQFPDGAQLEARVVYVDPELDLALLKADAPSAGYAFTPLTIGDMAQVRQGEEVLAVGNPGDAMLFSVTKGIVSAVGRFPSAGPGTWIQTDTPINPGNSGGPLLNGRGEVIGLNTQKLIKKNVTGIGFALSSADLLGVLRRFYPAMKGAPEEQRIATTSESSLTEVPATTTPMYTPAIESPPDGFGVVTIASDPDAAEIYVDGKFYGNAPATVRLAAGTHGVVLKARNHAEYARKLEVTRGSKLTLRATLEAASN